MMRVHDLPYCKANKLWVRALLFYSVQTEKYKSQAGSQDMGKINKMAYGPSGCV